MTALLLGNKVSVDCHAKNGLTALHLAAQEDHVDVARVLVDNSCTIDPHTKVVA